MDQMSDFKNFGYPTSKPCDVCGNEGNNQSEPRFGYVVCEEHYKMSPVEVTDLIEKFETTFNDIKRKLRGNKNV